MEHTKNCHYKYANEMSRTCGQLNLTKRLQKALTLETTKNIEFRDIILLVFGVDMNPSMLIVCIKRYLKWWMKFTEAPQTYEALGDFFVEEQFIDSSPADLSTHLLERKLVDLEEMVRSAELFLTTQWRQLNVRARQEAINAHS